MSSATRKRSDSEQPSKEERKHALLQAISLPMLNRTAPVPAPVAQDLAPQTEWPAVRRSRAKYAI